MSNIEHQTSGGGWISGTSTGGGDIVSAAITALQAFGGGLDRYQAANLLNLWSRRTELTAADRAAVLEHFGRTQ